MRDEDVKTLEALKPDFEGRALLCAAYTMSGGVIYRRTELLNSLGAARSKTTNNYIDHKDNLRWHVVLYTWAPATEDSDGYWDINEYLPLGMHINDASWRKSKKKGA